MPRPQPIRQSFSSGPKLDSLDVSNVDEVVIIPSTTEDERDNLRSTLFTSSSNDSETSLGAAASLRARLMKIRERNKSGHHTSSGEMIAHKGISVELQIATMDVAAVPQSNASIIVHTEDVAERTSCDNDRQVAYLPKYLDAIRRLLSRDLPLSEEDSEIIESTDVLKSIHAAVSQQPGLAVNLDIDGVTRLRHEIKTNSNEVVETLTRLIPFGFDCHGPDCNGGMSVPLLSVNLASLMAIFRSEDVAKSIRVEDLTVLIKEAGKALLDSRLASSSPAKSLDEATSTQMVRAINKLAVQAATGSKRHFAFEALMTLQQQICLKVDPSANQLFNSRLCRVVSKLFSRVVKAEEANPSPFAPPSVDLESIICVMEDTLSACDEAERNAASSEAVAATKNLAVALVTAILNARGEADKLIAQMKDLEINSESALGRIVSQIADEMGIKAPDPVIISRQQSSVEIAALVSAVGEASVGPERDAAVSALKAYKAEYGEEDLSNHLTHVSAAFRTFILEHLSENAESIDTEKATPRSMSERIKSLRSKLNATEVVVQSAIQRTSSTSSETNATDTENSGHDVIAASKPATASSGGVLAFRKRLAAARNTSGTAEQKETPETTSTAGSRAAALRARLQAVKRQTEL